MLISHKFSTQLDFAIWPGEDYLVIPKLWSKWAAQFSTHRKTPRESDSGSLVNCILRQPVIVLSLTCSSPTVLMTCRPVVGRFTDFGRAGSHPQIFVFSHYSHLFFSFFSYYFVLPAGKDYNNLKKKKNVHTMNFF